MVFAATTKDWTPSDPRVPPQSDQAFIVGDLLSENGPSNFHRLDDWLPRGHCMPYDKP